MHAPASFLPFLKRVFLFSGLTENILLLIAKKAAVVSFPKGAVLIKEKEISEAFYMVLSGSVRVTAKSSGTRPSGPLDKTVAFLSRGDVLGEMAFLSGDPSPVTAIVEAPSEMLVLRKKAFDDLLENTPTLAVHISRILSRRMADTDRTVHPHASSGKLFAFVAALPIWDQMVLIINFATAFVQQTRKKTLLFVVHETPEVLANSLGLELPHYGPPEIRRLFTNETDNFKNLLLSHPSGLDLIILDRKTFFSALLDLAGPVYSLLQEQYDDTLFFLPMEADMTLLPFLEEADRSAVFVGPQTHTADFDRLKNLIENLKDIKKIEKIWLRTGSDLLPQGFSPDMRLPWKTDWGRHFMETGKPFLPLEETLAHRTMDRLARHFGNLVIGFAMGSGAAFGYSLIGILKVLEREGIYPDVISGTSMGALIGAFYAAGKSPDEIEDIAKSITKKRLWKMMDLSFSGAGLLRGMGVLNFLRSILGDKTTDDLLLPFACVATDIQTGKEIILDQGNVAENVRASLSLPFFFQPFFLNGRYLVDGGLVNPVPTSVIVNQGANILMSANLTSRTVDRKVPRVGGWKKRLTSLLKGPSLSEVMLKTIYTMQYEIAQARAALAHVVMQINASDMLWWDLDRAGEIIQIGQSVAEESLPKIKALLPYFADSCRVHLAPKGRKAV